jgi:hypothetical protein
LLLLVVAGCGGSPPEPAPTPAAPPTPEPEARAELAGLAAAAQDRTLAAIYTLRASGREDRAVSVTLAADGSWRVDVPGGALGGTADVSVARTGAGLFQCGLSPAPFCARIGDGDVRLAAAIDPQVQHPFVEAKSVLADPGAPLAVSATSPLPGAVGKCFSVETTAASVGAPLDVGIYCYDPDGTLTAARLAYGTLLLSGAPGAAPPSVTLPGPVTGESPLKMASPPPPSPSVSASPSP